MDKRCATCGKQLQPEQGFCDQCGSAWTAPAKGNGSGKTLGLIGLIVVIALGIGGWLFVTHRAVAAPAATKPTDASPVRATTVPVMTPEAAAKSKPCSVISADDMATIMGRKIVKLTNTEVSCSYFTDAEASVQVDTTWTGGKAAMAETKGFNSGEGLLTPVAGIGDEAYSQAAGVLHVLKGDTYVVVNSREYENHDETELAIAKKIMEKMQ